MKNEYPCCNCFKVLPMGDLILNKQTEEYFCEACAEALDAVAMDHMEANEVWFN
jgi:hydroxylamine reductase (hybrid-cluster protein)